MAEAELVGHHLISNASYVPRPEAHATGYYARLSGSRPHHTPAETEGAAREEGKLACTMPSRERGKARKGLR